MAEKGQIIVPVVFDVSQTGNAKSGAGASFQGGATPNAGFGSQSAPKANNAFLEGISAQMVVENFTRIITATGNTELASSISKGSSYAFLGLRVLSSGGANIGADIALVTRIAADLIKLIQQEKEERTKTAEAYNETDLLRMRAGLLQFNANTVISTDKYKRFNFTQRR